VKTPPAFQLYVQDFLLGVLTFSNEQVGAYMRLLCYQWSAGSIPDHDKKIARILNETRYRSRKLWNEISSKFFLDSDGCWRNPRLEEVRRKQREYSELQAAKARLPRRRRRKSGSRSAKVRYVSGNGSSSSSSSSSSKSRRRARVPRALPLQTSPQATTETARANDAATEVPIAPRPVAGARDAKLAAVEQLRMLKANLDRPDVESTRRARR
jgi:uncharacterized protein YdaU (DUF1376 family)